MPNATIMSIVGHGIYRHRPICPRCYSSKYSDLISDDTNRSLITDHKIFRIIMSMAKWMKPTAWSWICRLCLTKYRTPAQSHFLSCPLCDGECEICRGRKFMRL